MMIMWITQPRATCTAAAQHAPLRRRLLIIDAHLQPAAKLQRALLPTSGAFTESMQTALGAAQAAVRLAPFTAACHGGAKGARRGSSQVS